MRADQLLKRTKAVRAERQSDFRVRNLLLSAEEVLSV